MGQIKNEVLLQKISLGLKALREYYGLSQEQVYNDTDIHIARIETGKVNVSVSTLDALCTYFETTMEEFFKSIGK